MNKDLTKIDNQCRYILNQCGYGDYVTLLPNITLNGRLKTTLGRCTSRRIDNNIDVYKVELSKGFYDAESERNIQEVILHEYIHGLANLIHSDFVGHDSRWKAIAKHINDEYGYNIRTTYSFKNDYQLYTSNLKRARYNKRYEIYCTKCGKYLGIAKRRDKNYIHSTCKGELEYILIGE